MRNVDGTFNKEEPIEHTVEVNIYYQEYQERMEIDVIGEQKWNVILGMLWLACHNPEIDWRTEKVKMMRCPEECVKHRGQNKKSQSGRNRKMKRRRKKKKRNKK